MSNHINAGRRVLLAAVLCAASAPVLADAWLRVDKFTDYSPAADTSANFGTALGISLDANHAVNAIVVGAPRQSVNNLAEAGAVYVLVPQGQGWTVDHELTAAIPQASAHFGAAIALEGDSLAVGAPDYQNGQLTGAGAVYFFNNVAVSGTPNFHLVADHFGLYTDAHFGAAVAVDGAFAIIGIPGYDNSRGHVEIVNRHPDGGWYYVDDSTPASAVAGDLFGYSVAIRQLSSTGILAIIGSPGRAQNGQSYAGAAGAYALDQSNFLVPVGDLPEPNPGLHDGFGASVGLDAQYAYVGATGRNKPAVGTTGSVSVFKPAQFIGFDFVREILPGAGAKAGDLCGQSLAVDPTRSQFIIGCPNSDGLVANEGFARLYRADPIFINTPTWSESRLDVGDLAHGVDTLGKSVGVIGDRAFLGAPDTNVGAQTDRGALETFVRDAIFKDGFDGAIF